MPATPSPVSRIPYGEGTLRPSSPSHRPGYAAALGDARYVCPATSAAALAARHTRVYHYHFDYRCSPGLFRDFWGVPHSSEIAFIWRQRQRRYELI